MGKHLIIFIMLMAWQVWGATYYIDYEQGDDSRDGQSTQTAWKVHPYMNGFSGSYTHHAGDRFIFKGGVTWPNLVFAMNITNGGASGNSDYYGVDKTWFTGNTWARPVFNAQNTVITNRCFIGISAANVTIDNFEMTGYYWDAQNQGWGTAMVRGGSLIKNCYFHNWSHASAASGCLDDLRVVNGASVVDSCIFDGSPNGSTSGFASDAPTNRNSVARNMTNGFLPGGSSGLLEVSGCTIGPINSSFDGVQHPNSIEQLGGGTIYIHHNVIFGATAICIFVGNPGNLAYIYNNLIYDSGPIPIQFDGRSGTGTGYVYNNTFFQNGTIIRNGGALGTPWTVTVRNNHVIGDGGSIGSDHNLVQTAAQGLAAGYTRANNWKPATASAPTVDAGTSLTNEYATDLLYVTRPQGSGWDIGAYEYTDSSPVSYSAAPTAGQYPADIPNPVKIWELKGHTGLNREWQVYDIRGGTMEPKHIYRPGIYLIKGKDRRAFQKTVVVED